MREGVPDVRGTLCVWRQVGRAVGARAISLRVLEFSRGLSPGLRNFDCDEVLYALEAEAELFIDGRTQRVTAETGIYLRPAETLPLTTPDSRPFVLVSPRCPDPHEQSAT